MSSKRKRPEWNTRASFWTDAEAKEALSTVRNRLRRSGRLKFHLSKMTEEVIFAALCLWADAQPVEALESQLGPFVSRLESLVPVAHEKAPDQPNEGHAEGVKIRTVNRPSGGKGRKNSSGLRHA